uniref:ATP synthase F0 subunit 8 n=1 Tax=Boreoheptagyia kurobebrevis TaxID=2851578 RepID=UPI00202814E3|nr:ATP synthase F0 subunit 8 [Boreoheptagyia kurobebrevis]UQJ73463.1 ATP synthase F0 subunit 8 [Boreoheptagyia kurobebrevis]
MPQMAPISWLVLFLLFSLTLILFNILNYYCVLPKTLGINEKKNSSKIFSSLNWKW